MLIGLASRLRLVARRVARIVTFRERDDRRNIASLADHLGICRDDAEWLYGRSREVGYPTALAELERRSDSVH